MYEGIGIEFIMFFYLFDFVFSFLLNMQVVSIDVIWIKFEAANCPFYMFNLDASLLVILLFVLFFCVYEVYYNVFGCDICNNFFIVDGKFEYNKYVLSIKGGYDFIKYQLCYVNWEFDVYIIVLQFLQFGIVFFVGIIFFGEVIFCDVVGIIYIV